MLLATSYLQLPYHVVMVVEPRVRERSSCLFLGYHRMNQCNLTQYNDTSIQLLVICILMDIQGRRHQSGWSGFQLTTFTELHNEVKQSL